MPPGQQLHFSSLPQESSRAAVEQQTTLQTWNSISRASSTPHLTAVTASMINSVINKKSEKIKLKAVNRKQATFFFLPQMHSVIMIFKDTHWETLSAGGRNLSLMGAPIMLSAWGWENLNYLCRGSVWDGRATGSYCMSLYVSNYLWIQFRVVSGCNLFFFFTVSQMVWLTGVTRGICLHWKTPQGIVHSGGCVKWKQRETMHKSVAAKEIKCTTGLLFSIAASPDIFLWHLFAINNAEKKRKRETRLWKFLNYVLKQTKKMCSGHRNPIRWC